MDILVLIIAGGTEYTQPYLDMETVWRKYMNDYPFAKCFFIKMCPEENDIRVDRDNNTIWVRGEECLIPGILRKTVRCIQYALDETFDYVVRTNMSSVLNLPLLYGYLVRYRERGHVVDYYGARIENYVEGSCMVLSRNACDYLVKHADLNSTVFDDRAIGKTLYPQFQITNHPKRDVLTMADLNKLQDSELYKHFHFRCKSKGHTCTVDIMNEVLSRIMQHYAVHSVSQPIV